MFACTLSHMVAVLRKSDNLLSLVGRKYFSKWGRLDTRIISIDSQNRTLRRLLCSSVRSRQSLHFENPWSTGLRKNSFNENRLITSVQNLMKKCSYTTASVVDLSFSNVKVQKYISHLKESYEKALSCRDNDNYRMVRNLEPVIKLIHKMELVKSEIEELQELAQDSSSGKEMQKLAESDLQEANSKLCILEDDILNALVPSEKMDDSDIAIEVNAGVGGQEAMLFCQEIFDMYLSYANYMGWKTESNDQLKTELGGLRHGVAVFSGQGVHRLLKYEGGVHRVQRVPKTEKSGRIHTTTVSVAVIPQPSEIDIQIAAKDLKIDTKRAKGAGGQHVNTTDSAIRVTHIPSGVVVECQTERCQHQNKIKCMNKLRAILYQQELDASIQQSKSRRKLQVGTKARSEKIRTYNYAQDRVTDHRIGVSLQNLPSILEGMDALHSLICQLIQEAEKERLLEIIDKIIDS